MTVTQQNRKSRNRRLLTNIRGLLQAMPSREEKEELESAITELASFFTEVQSLVAQLPAAEDYAQVNEALAHIEQLLERRNTSPLIRSLLGARRTPPAKPSLVPTENENQRAKAMVGELRSLPPDVIRQRLSNGQTHNIRLLLAISGELGLRIPSRPVRESLVQQIVTSIVNQRGYEALRSS